MEATFVTAIEQQIFPECWCGHKVVRMVGQIGEKRLEDLTQSCTPVAQNLLVTLKSGNFSERVSLPGRGIHQAAMLLSDSSGSSVHLGKH